MNLPPEWPGYDRPEWREQHDKLIGFRHAFVSHSQRASRRIIVMSTDDPDGWRTGLDLPPLFMFPGEGEQTRAMCHDLLSRLNDELGQACRALITRERKLQPVGPIEVRIPRD